MSGVLSSLRTRLLLTYIILIVVGFGGLTLLAGQQLTEGAIEDFTTNLEVQTFLVASTLREPLEHLAEDESNPAQITTLLNRYVAETNTRITLLGIDGQAIFDTSGQLPTTNFSNDPEIVGAINQQAVSDLRPDEAGTPTFYTAAPVLYENRPLAYVRLSAPAAIPQATVNQRRLALIVGFGIFALLSLILSLWLSSTLTRPLSKLRDTALDIAQGDLSQRVERPGSDEIGAVGQAFNQMATQVEAMVEEQRAFASNVSHELRTPLTTIRLRTEGLLANALDEPTAKQYISEIDSEVTRLGGLVDDLILLSRLDAERMTIGQEQIDAVRLAKSLVREMEPQATARQIALHLESTSSLPTVQTNVNHLQVVLRNLLENAIKYTSDGGQVAWYFAQEDGFLQIAVQDNGQGIAAEDLPHLNKRFFRVDKAHTRRIQGTGLGLALVQSIVDLYGGRFEIASPGLGQGTTATVWWPLGQMVSEIPRP